MKHTPAAERRRAVRMRAGMTLTEVLFATGILLVGVLSIMSLVPVSIHQVASTSDNTIGAAVARNAFIALRYGHLDAMDHVDPDEPAETILYNTAYRNGDIQLYGVGAESNLADFAGWPAVIYARHWRRADYSPASDRASYGYGYCGTNTAAAGHGPAFQIPGDTVLFQQATVDTLFQAGSRRRAVLETLTAGGNTYDHPKLIPSGWAQDYYWSATFLPIAADDDGDGTIDEDRFDTLDNDDDSDGVLNEDDTVMPGTSYRVQLAVWRVVNPQAPLMLYGGDSGNPRTADWTEGTNTVTIKDGDLRGVKNFDYIRMDDYGVWYRIASIEDQTGPNPVVTLVSPFTHPDTGQAFNDMNISITNDFKLVGLYEDVVTAPELGGTP